MGKDKEKDGPKKDYDGTLARMAGNLAPAVWTSGVQNPENLAVICMAAALAIRTLAKAQFKKEQS